VQPPAPESTNNILLITLSNIGDTVMTTPVMQALHAKYPQAVMDIVTDARAVPLFSHCPYRRELLLKDKQAGWRGLLPLIKQLRTTRYDLAVDLRTDGLTWLLRARRRLGRGLVRADTGHAVERHFAVIRQRERLADIPPPCVWLSAAERDFARQALQELPGRRWLALGPGARWPPKCWPAVRFGGLVRQLQSRFDACVLLGSEADAAACREVADSLPLPCLDLAGRTGLLQATAVLALAQVFVGNDSGLGHLAAAAGTPTVTVFGPGDPRRYHPWHPLARWVQSPTDRIEDVDLAMVTNEVVTLLDSFQDNPAN